jgi:hypothetical protein
MRRRSVVRRAGMKFAMALLDHIEPSSSRINHRSEVFAGRMAKFHTMEDRRPRPVEVVRTSGTLPGVELGQQLNPCIL